MLSYNPSYIVVCSQIFILQEYMDRVLLTFLDYLLVFPVPSVIIVSPFWGYLSEVVLPVLGSAGRHQTSQRLGSYKSRTGALLWVFFEADAWLAQQRNVFESSRQSSAPILHVTTLQRSRELELGCSCSSSKNNINNQSI